MKTEKEKLLKETYDKFVRISMIDLPMEGMEEFIDQDIMGYGTTVDEKVMSIADYRKLVIRQREQGKDIKMTFSTTPVLLRITSDGNSAVFIDEMVISMVINNENLQLFLRISTVLEYREEKWVVVHWHASKPEYEEGETDTWHINELKQKTEKLENMVAEKTADLEIKNRELEIESSLERVRSVAMSMNKSDDLLNICEKSFKELKKLGFDNLRNAVIHIPNDEQKYFMDYDYSEFTGGDIAKIEFGSHPIVDEYIKKIVLAKESFFEVVIEKDQMKAWKEFRENSGQSDDSRLDEAEALYYYLFSIGIGDIGISTFSPINDSQIKILKRFRNVFNLAYRRYTDITLAEAQAREAQIETALEKVRSMTMAMQKGEDLKEVVVLLYKELIALGVTNFVTCGYVEINEKIKRQLTWVTSPGGDSLGLFYLPLTGDATFDERYAAWKQQQIIFHQKVAGEVRSKHLEYAITTFNSKEAEEMVLSQFPDPCIFYCFNFSHGYLHLITGSKLKNEEELLLARFTKVFEQTYARFLDLQKAEAQAREAQIETALERVRSRTMGMQKSDELKDAAILLFQQIESLAVPVFGCGFNIWDDDRKAATAWMAGKDRLQPQFKTSSAEDIFLRIHKAAEKGASLFVEEQSGEALKAHYEYMKSIPIFKEIADKMTKAGESFPSFQIMHCAYFSQGYLMFISFEPVPGAHDIFKRFAKVFQQTYTRFHDLQNAEAQIREAQIEAALERARTQSILMQYSDELSKTANVFHEQLQLLGVNSEFSYLWLPDEEKAEHLFWATWQDDPKNSTSYKNRKVIYPLDKTAPSIAACYTAWESDEAVHINTVAPSEVENYFKTWEELLYGIEKFNPIYFLMDFTMWMLT